MRAVLAALLVLHGGWMLVDGAIALATGDYLGSELGPWAAIVRSAGIEPLAMALPFVLLGLAALALAVAVWRRPSQAAVPAALIGIATLWYAVVGTILALAILAVSLRIRPLPWRRV